MPYASVLSSSPIAAASVARDLEDECPNAVDEVENTVHFEDETQFLTRRHTRSSIFSRRSSFVDTTSALHPTVLPPVSIFPGARGPTVDNEISLEEDRDLLQDHHTLPDARQPFAQSQRTILSRIRDYLGLERTSNRKDDALSRAELAEPSESSPLLTHGQHPFEHGQIGPSDTSNAWERAVAAGIIQTTWKRETTVLANYSLPLIVTSLLQHTLTMVSIVTVGHLGKVELGAASLASMTATITGYTVYYGLATSLDTLSAQAYGSDLKELVGIQLQRMTYFLWLVTVPIGLLWFYSAPLLQKILPDPELARLVGLYLKVLLCGAPACAAFEAGKRFVQAQGLFNASLGVLSICAPLNAFLHWLFVWVSKVTSVCPMALHELILCSFSCCR